MIEEWLFFAGLIGLAAIISFIVSMDVSVVTIGNVKRFGHTGGKSYETNVKEKHLWCMTHAFWHAFLLALGIVIFTFADFGISEFLKPLLDSVVAFLEQLPIDFAPLAAAIDGLIWLLNLFGGQAVSLIAILFFVVLYFGKMGAAAGKSAPPEPVIYRIVNRLIKMVANRFGKTAPQIISYNTLAVSVAIDMYFLTPLIKVLLDQQTPLQRVIFVFLVFIFVYIFIWLLITALNEFVFKKASLSSVTLAFVSVLLILAEPLSSGYFASRLLVSTIGGGSTSDGLWHLCVSMLMLVMFVAPFGLSAIVKNQLDELGLVVTNKSTKDDEEEGL